MLTPEHQLEEKLIEKRRSLKYEYRPDIRDRVALEQNFRKKFEALNRKASPQPVWTGRAKPCQDATLD